MSRDRTGPTPNRRTVMAGIAATAAAGPAMAGPGDKVALHDYAAVAARDLAGGRPIELAILAPQGCEDNIDPVIAAFSRRTGIAVRRDVTPVDDINMRLTLDTLAQDGGHDIALPATFGIPDLAIAGAIRPIDDFARQHEPAGFRERGLYRVGDDFDGRLFGFQTDGDAYLMFYNRDFLDDPDEAARYEDQTGMALAPPRTWEELDGQMAFFHRPDQGRYGGLLFRTPGYLGWEWWVRFHAKGIWPLSPDLEPQIAGDAGVAALEEMIRATDHLDPAVFELGLFDNWRRYARGNVYANIGWGGTQKALMADSATMGGKLVHGPTPGGIVNGELLTTPYFNWGWTYVVTANTAHPELAYLFTLFAASPEMSTVSVQARGGYFDPFRPEHYADATIRETYSDDFLAVHRDSLSGAIPDLYLAAQGSYMTALRTWLDRALHRDISPRVALENAANHWRLITARQDRSDQIQRWAGLRNRYPTRIREALRDL